MGRYERCIVRRERRGTGGWRQVRAFTGHSHAQGISIHLRMEGLCPAVLNGDTAQCLMVMAIPRLVYPSPFQKTDPHEAKREGT